MLFETRCGLSFFVSCFPKLLCPRSLYGVFISSAIPSCVSNSSRPQLSGCFRSPADPRCSGGDGAEWASLLHSLWPLCSTLSGAYVFPLYHCAVSCPSPDERAFTAPSAFFSQRLCCRRRHRGLHRHLRAKAPKRSVCTLLSDLFVLQRDPDRTFSPSRGEVSHIGVAGLRRVSPLAWPPPSRSQMAMQFDGLLGRPSPFVMPTCAVGFQ